LLLSVELLLASKGEEDKVETIIPETIESDNPDPDDIED
jgi:hypothetical protein